MVDESDRVWLNIDDIRKTLSDHCIRLTRVEDYHYHKDKSKSWNLSLVLLSVVVIEGIFIVIDYLS